MRVLGVRTNPGGRLNVLLSDGDQPWAQQLPRLLEPMGVRSIRIAHADEALEVIRSEPIHAAVIDVGLPMGESLGPHATGGLKLLRVIQRLEPTPPAVVVRGRLFDKRLDNQIGRAHV